AASTDKPLSGGNLKIDVAYFGLYIHSESHELCQETSCPATGDFVISHSQVLPGITPPGSYTLKLTLDDGDKHQLTCINFDFSIGWWFGAADA
ncbi:ML domain-containing protein, partial [Mycobacterium kansasii]